MSFVYEESVIRDSDKTSLLQRHLLESDVLWFTEPKSSVVPRPAPPCEMSQRLAEQRDWMGSAIIACIASSFASCCEHTRRSFLNTCAVHKLMLSDKFRLGGLPL